VYLKTYLIPPIISQIGIQMQHKIKQSISLALSITQDIGLVIVAISTIVAIGIEIGLMLDNQFVSLSDLLLLFIYLEVLTMVAVYYKSGELPIKIPMYIAIVALARYLILDMKNFETWRILGIAGAILVIGLAIVVIHYCQEILASKIENTKL
jgi:protein PsiE